jgi:DnaK suppressor protein
MTKTELNAFRKVLENSQTELGNGNRNREALAIETSPDDLDRIQHASERDDAMNNLERNFTRLVEVRTALRRIDAGTFGICAGCEENINPRRLAAVPCAPFCIVCQGIADREQKAAWNDSGTSLGMAGAA